MFGDARRFSSLVQTNPVKRSISSVLGIVAWNSSQERGIPSRRESSYRVNYVPVLCTHRPSLLPIEWFSETVGRIARVILTWLARKTTKLYHLEEVKVVTRLP